MLDASSWRVVRVVYPILASVAVVGICLNTLLLLATLTRKTMRSTANIIIGCCALFDIIHQCGYLIQFPILFSDYYIDSFVCSCMINPDNYFLLITRSIFSTVKGNITYTVMTRKPSVFEGVSGYPRIRQDELALARALYIGVLSSNREQIRNEVPGMGVNDSHLIQDSVKRQEYVDICKQLDSSLRSERTQTKNVKMFAMSFGISPEHMTKETLLHIQQLWSGVYRLGVFRHHATNKSCEMEWVGKVMAPRTIILITDGTKWDCVSEYYSLFKSSYFCKGCLKPARSRHTHR